MSDLKIHHYGLATDNLERSIEVLRLLGYQIGEITIDPIQKVRVAFASRSHPGEMIELICDIEADGPTHGLLAKTGSGLYHICYEVDHLEETMKKLSGERFVILRSPVPAAACHGKRIAWMYNRHVGLIELLEK
jgi:methylmalonyl-CoA/ethylmalonyl-CoA epimerase